MVSFVHAGHFSSYTAWTLPESLLPVLCYTAYHGDFDGPSTSPPIQASGDNLGSSTSHPIEEDIPVSRLQAKMPNVWCTPVLLLLFMYIPVSKSCTEVTVFRNK